MDEMSQRERERERERDAHGMDRGGIYRWVGINERYQPCESVILLMRLPRKAKSPEVGKDSVDERQRERETDK